MSDFLDTENDERSPDYRRAGADESLLEAMNAALTGLEPTRWSQVARPAVFVFGLPRSGTTLTYQLLASGLEVGYVDNLVARFWLAPCQGIAVSRAVFGDRRTASFHSDLGRSTDPRGPHEFAYFWRHWLGIAGTEDLLAFGSPRRPVDWPAVVAAVGRMQDALSAPMVFKTNYVGQWTDRFCSAFPMPLVVYPHRRPVDVALSILRARRRYYGDPDHWWATFPPEYATLADQDVVVQIVGQVHGLRRAYRDQLDRVPRQLVLEVDYAELCADPSAVVGAVAARVEQVHGVAIARSAVELPSFFAERRLVPEDDLEARLAAAVGEGPS